MGERASRRLDAEALFEHALRVLSARAHSIAELREKLLRRAERTQDVPSVLTRLKQYGYLDDRSFAAGFSVSRLENQGLGGRRVLSDLRKRRVAPRWPRKPSRRLTAAWMRSSSSKLSCVASIETHR